MDIPEETNKNGAKNSCLAKSTEITNKYSCIQKENLFAQARAS